MDDGKSKAKAKEEDAHSSKLGAAAAAAAAQTKIPMSNKKVAMEIFIVGSSSSSLNGSEGSEAESPIPMLEHPAISSIRDALEYSALPTPNPDGISQSQLLLYPALSDPPSDVSAVEVRCLLPPEIGPLAVVDVSAFVVTLSPPGFLKTEATLPFPCDWKKCNAFYDGANGTLVLTIPLLAAANGGSGSGVDKPDVGSRQWGLAEALSGGAAGAGDDALVGSGAPEKKTKKGDDAASSSSFAEDKFHLNVPKGYNLHSGVLQTEDESSSGGNDTGEYPEDRFHRADIMSQHIIDQQNGERQKKIDKADTERRERATKKKLAAGGAGADDDIEYLDVDDFKPGGKYYHGKDKLSASSEPDNPDLVLYVNEDLKHAAGVLAKKAKEAASASSGGAGASGSGNEAGSNVVKKPTLKSSMWTELLD